MRHATFLILITLILSSTNTFATTYFVKDGGNDNASGTSDSQAWATTTKVNSFSFATGDDVYFKAGDVWRLKTLTIDWAGTSNNRAVVGSYYVNSSGSTVIGVPSGTNKPTITGGYTSTTNTGSVPNNIWTGLVAINANFVTLQNFKVQDSSGMGIIVGGGGSGTNSIIENNEVVHTAGALIQVYRENENIIIRKNTGSQCNWSRIDKINPYGSAGSHPACIGLVKSDNNLIENNSLYDLFGEGIDVYQGSDFNTIRGNFISNAQLAIYIDASNNNLVENNIILGKGVAQTYFLVGGIAVTIEGTNGSLNTKNNIIRNNFIAGVGSCFYSDVWSAPIAEGMQTGGKFIGNSCIGADKGIDFFKGNNAYSNWEIANNIFWDISNKASACKLPTDTDINIHHNSWDTSQTDTDCAGTGDLIGNPLLNTTSDFRLFSYSNQPKPHDFQPQSGSPVSNAGLATSSLMHDYYKQVRPASPSLGALEPGSISPPTGLSIIKSN